MRSYAMTLLKTLPVSRLMHFVYPQLFALHTLPASVRSRAARAPVHAATIAHR